MLSSSAVQVAVRVRPPLSREINANNEFNACLACTFQANLALNDGERSDTAADRRRSTADSAKNTIYITTTDSPVLVRRDGSVTGDVQRFQFNYVFDQDQDTRSVYNACCKAAVRKVVTEGINATIFAYGQTGTGKTYTMVGAGGARKTSDLQPGAVQLAASDILELAQACLARVCVSYMQIYLNTVTDLLACGESQQDKHTKGPGCSLANNIRLRQDTGTG